MGGPGRRGLPIAGWQSGKTGSRAGLAVGQAGSRAGRHARTMGQPQGPHLQAPCVLQLHQHAFHQRRKISGHRPLLRRLEIVVGGVLQQAPAAGGGGEAGRGCEP